MMMIKVFNLNYCYVCLYINFILTHFISIELANEDDNVTKSPAGSPSSSLESSKQTKKLHLDFDDAIIPDLVPRIVIEDNERNSSAEKTISHESAISPEEISRSSVSKLWFHSNL